MLLSVILQPLRYHMKRYCAPHFTNIILGEISPNTADRVAYLQEYPISFQKMTRITIFINRLCAHNELVGEFLENLQELRQMLFDVVFPHFHKPICAC